MGAKKTFLHKQDKTRWAEKRGETIFAANGKVRAGIQGEMKKKIKLNMHTAYKNISLENLTRILQNSSKIDKSKHCKEGGGVNWNEDENGRDVEYFCMQTFR